MIYRTRKLGALLLHFLHLCTDDWFSRTLFGFHLGCNWVKTPSLYGTNRACSPLLPSPKQKRTKTKRNLKHKCSLVAAFGSGACFSLVSGVGNSAASVTASGAPANPFMAAISTGVAFAVFQGLFYKLGETFAGPKTEEVHYARVKAMLKALGLAVRIQQYFFLHLLFL
jgi:hypothetical protein